MLSGPRSALRNSDIGSSRIRTFDPSGDWQKASDPSPATVLAPNTFQTLTISWLQDPEQESTNTSHDKETLKKSTFHLSPPFPAQMINIIGFTNTDLQWCVCSHYNSGLKLHSIVKSNPDIQAETNFNEMVRHQPLAKTTRCSCGTICRNMKSTKRQRFLWADHAA